MVLDVKGVTVGYYEDVLVLNNVSLRAQEEKITLLIGPNGAGKSTVLKTIFGFLRPRRGQILLNHKDITGHKPFRMLKEGIAYVMQEHGILPFMTVEENLELGTWPFRKDRRKVKGAIQQIYSKYPILRERKRVQAGNLSGGEQRILEMGKALLTDPQVILFDEPTAGLAPLVTNTIFEEIKKLRGEGRTILMVEQNVRKAMTISDYVYVLEFGRIKFEGTADQVDLKDAITPWISW